MVAVVVMAVITKGVEEGQEKETVATGPGGLLKEEVEEG